MSNENSEAVSVNYEVPQATSQNESSENSIKPEVLLTGDEMIEQSLKKYEPEKGVTYNKKIADLKEMYKGLQIENIDDKEGYKKVSEAISILRPLRTGVEKKRKELVEFSNKYNKAVNAEAKRITELIEEIEIPLKERKDLIDGEKDRIKAELEIEAEAKVQRRVNELLQNGVQFDNNYYSIGDYSISVVDLRNMSDETYNSMFQAVQSVYAKIQEENKAKEEAERLERERLQKQKEEQEAESERLRKEREEFEAKQREFEQQQAELKKQILNARIARVEAVGLLYSNISKSFIFKNELGQVEILMQDLESDLDPELTSKIENAKISVENLKVKYSEIEKQRAIEAQKQIEKEQEEARILSEKLEEEKRKLREAQAPDREKAITFFNKVLNLFVKELPTLSEDYLKNQFETEVKEIQSALRIFLKSYETNEN